MAARGWIVFIAAAALGACAPGPSLDVPAPPGVPHGDRSFAVTYGGAEWRATARYLSAFEETVIAVREGEADAGAERIDAAGALPEARFDDDAMRPAALDVAAAVVAQDICPDGTEFNFSLRAAEEGGTPEIKAFFYGPREAWTVFGYCAS